MWLRSLTLLASLLTAAMLLTGCEAAEWRHGQAAMSPHRAAEDRPPSPAAEPPTWAGAAAEPDRAQRARMEADIDRAVGLIAELEYGHATAILRRLTLELASDPNAPRAGEVWFWLGYCREKQDLPAEAREHYVHVLEQYPRRPAAVQASRRLGILDARKRPGQSAEE